MNLVSDSIVAASEETLVVLREMLQTAALTETSEQIAAEKPMISQDAHGLLERLIQALGRGQPITVVPDTLEIPLTDAARILGATREGMAEIIAAGDLMPVQERGEIAVKVGCDQT